jgi:hypothetical protein
MIWRFEILDLKLADAFLIFHALFNIQNLKLADVILFFINKQTYPLTTTLKPHSLLTTHLFTH